MYELYSQLWFFHITGYFVFHFKHILFECLYELFSHSNFWGKNWEYTTRKYLHIVNLMVVYLTDAMLWIQQKRKDILCELEGL